MVLKYFFLGLKNLYRREKTVAKTLGHFKLFRSKFFYDFSHKKATVFYICITN